MSAITGEEVVAQIIKMTDTAETMGDLHQLLHAIAYAVGGMILHFDEDERSRLMVSLVETMGTALMNTSVTMGEKCDIEMVVGKSL